MGKIFNGISDQKVLFFTEAMAQRAAVFTAPDQMITPANEKQIMNEAEEQAKRFAEARNRGASPKAYTPDQESIINEVRAWLSRKGKRMRGGK